MWGRAPSAVRSRKLDVRFEGGFTFTNLQLLFPANLSYSYPYLLRPLAPGTDHDFTFGFH